MRKRRREIQRHRPLGDIGRVVANAFDIRCHPQGRQDHAQVTSEWAATDQVDHIVVDLMFKRIDGFVVADHALGGVVVAARDHIQRGLELRRRHLAHADQFGNQRFLFVVVALDDVAIFVVAMFVHQPKRPVM
jgi:hypothetical protein